MKTKFQTENYLSPAVEIVGVEVETGFAGSVVPGASAETTPYDTWSN